LQHEFYGVHAVFWAQFSYDGSRIITVSQDNTVRIWDAQNGQALLEPLPLGNTSIVGHFYPGRFADPRPGTAQFSLDDKRILSPVGMIWDAETGQLISQPLPATRWNSRVQFDPSGKRVVIAGLDGTARVWDVPFVRGKCPAWLLELAEVMAGQRLNPQSVLKPTKLDFLQTVEDSRSRLRQAQKDDLTQWAQWFLAEPSERTRSPFSK